MGFLNTFIGLSILAEESEQSAELEYHSALLNRQNDMIQEQNEQIESWIRQNKKQDQIRDYIYRINKLLERLENSSDKDSIDYYYSLYCLSKGINDSELTASAISELNDKEYFDNCLDRIGKLIFYFSRKNKDRLAVFNEHIQNLDESTIFYELKTSEDARYRIFQINNRIKDYEKEMSKKGWRELLGFLPLAAVAFLGFYLKITYYFYLPFAPYLEDYKYYGICGFLGVISIIVGKIVGKIWTEKAIKKQKNPLSEEEYNNLIQERADCERQISKDRILYEYANSEFPEFDFYDNYDAKEIEGIHSALEKKDREISKSFEVFTFSVADIYENYYLTI